MFWRLRWQLSCVVLAVAASAQISASNDSTAVGQYDGVLMLRSPEGDNITELVPLTRDAVMRNRAPLTGNLFNTNNETVGMLSTRDISYLSCNPADYAGGLDPSKLLQEAMENHNLTAVILYNTQSDYCGYDVPAEPLQEFPVFSMVDRSLSEKLLQDLTDQDVAQKFFVTISQLGEKRSDETDNSQVPQTSIGPSPSTAVAMVILYSITGIITCLFLVIIITGAIRAHRHPDRYGPRDVLGLPRQSRARGLGRAILDTIPIVKFGERESERPKPTDVELGSTSEARNVNTGDADVRVQGTNEGGASAASEQVEHSGIAPALPATAAASAPSENVDAETPTCSICTEEFLKGQDIRLLPCDHKYHPECVDPWLLNVSGTCPLCRVDLRPAEARTSRPSTRDGEEDPDALAPPLQPETDVSHRRRSALRDILGFRSRPNATAEERISALRRLREQRRNQSSEDAAENGHDEPEDAAAVRRSRRISARLTDVFGSRHRRHEADDAAGDVGHDAEAAGASSAGQTSAADTTPREQR